VDDAAYRTHTFDYVRDAYAEQIRALAEGGVDFLLIETVFDTLNAKAAIAAALDVAPELPRWLSFTAIDKSGRNLSGQTVEAFWLSVEHAEPFIVGVNCALGAVEMRPYVAELARLADCYVSCHPNAGLPNAFGQYDEQPRDTGAALEEFAASGFVNIVGGCCGTTPDHIREIAARVASLAPRRRPDRDASTAFTELAGLETLTIRPDSNFQMIGERTNVTGSVRFARLIRAGNFGEAARVALDQVRGGANLVDVNMDEGMLDSEAAMIEFLNLIAGEPDISKVPVTQLASFNRSRFRKERSVAVQVWTMNR